MLGREGQGEQSSAWVAQRGVDYGFQVGQSGTATTAVLRRPCQAVWRARRRGRGVAAQGEFPVLVQSQAMPSEFSAGEAVCDLRGLGRPVENHTSTLWPETGPGTPESK